MDSMIPQIVSDLRSRYADRDRSNSAVRAVRTGQGSKLLPGLFSQVFGDQSIVANLVDNAARDVAGVLAPLPSFEVIPDAGTDGARRAAAKRQDVVKCYLDKSKLQFQMQDGADYYNCYGLLVLRVVPDDDLRLPRVRVESPFGAYPAWDTWGRTRALARVTKVYRRDLEAEYPEVRSRRPRVGSTGDDLLEVIHYEDAKTYVCYVPSLQNLVLEEAPNPVGVCLATCVRRPGGDDLKGAYHDAIWIQLARHRLQSLLIEGVEKSVRAPLVVPTDTNDLALGPDAVIRTNSGAQAVGRARLDMPAQAFGAVDQLRAEVNIAAGSPEARSGNLDASIITGRGVQALSAGFSSGIATAQVTLITAYEEMVDKMFRLDVALWGGVKKTFSGQYSNTAYRVDYDPAVDVGDLTAVSASYGFAAGLDPNRATVLLLQAQGAELVSRNYVRRNLPLNINPDEEERSIAAEAARKMLGDAIASLAQALPQMVVSGQDPMSVVDALTVFTNKTMSGSTVEKASEAALAAYRKATEKATQAAQEQAPTGQPAAAGGMPGPAQSGPPDLQQLTAVMRGGGGMSASTQFTGGM